MFGGWLGSPTMARMTKKGGGRRTRLLEEFLQRVEAEEATVATAPLRSSNSQPSTARSPFEGQTPADFFELSAEATDPGEQEHLRRAGEILQHWHAYIESSKLRALDTVEAARVYNEAYDLVVSGEKEPVQAPGLEAPEEQWKTWMEAIQRRHNETVEKLQAWDYIVYPLMTAMPFGRSSIMWPGEQWAIAEIPAGQPRPQRFNYTIFDTSAAGEINQLVLGTGPIHRHMTNHVMNRQQMTETGSLRMTIDGRGSTYRARSRLAPPAGYQANGPDEMLRKMNETLLDTKEQSAALLKTQLDLINQAWLRGGDSPVFRYDYESALDRLGYRRLKGGYFHPETLREHHARVATLASQWLAVWELKGKKGQETYIDETPYWHIELRRRVQEGDTIGTQVILFPEPNTPVVKEVLIRPGVWWELARIGSFHYPLPASLLKLSTDGKGNETQRYALQLAAVLAVFVRASQARHTGERLPYGIGTLLEEASIITYEDFVDLRSDHADRKRRYLAGDNDDSLGGALGILQQTGAFDINIADPFAFWVSGRGWQEKFWEAQVTVRIPERPTQLSKR